MESMALTHKESFVFPQTPTGQRYANVVERNLRGMPGYVSRSEDTLSIAISYTFTGSIQVPEDMGATLDSAGFER